MDLRQRYSIHYRQASDLGARESNEDLSNLGWGIIFPKKIKQKRVFYSLIFWKF